MLRRYGADETPPVASHPLLLALALLLAASACATSRATPPKVTPAESESRAAVPAAAWPDKTYYRTVEVLGRKIFYREAGAADRPTVLLLHGYPSSSHTYRELIPLLSGHYHVLAPDYLGSGFSDHPSPSEVTYTFDLLAEHVRAFIEKLGVDTYVLYMQDFGAPVGFRLAIAQPERVRGLVVQNANAYLEGLTEPRRAFFKRAHEDRSATQQQTLRDFVSADAVVNRQYLRDVPGPKRERMSPDTWTHDLSFLESEEQRAIQVQLFQDYQSNIDRYPAWQAFLRARKPPTLIVWGEHDPAFIAEGARAYTRDLPDAELHLLDAGHFAAEEQPVAIAQHIVAFMERLARTN
jgi:pimeloyl-ACP methyl ester carboxylesterase